MKPYLITIFGLYLSSISYGQLLNGNFETWNTSSIETPVGWTTSNAEAISNGYPVNATKFAPGYAGSYALKLQTNFVGTDTSFAYFTNTVNDPMSGEGGVPYSMIPDSFIFYAKLGIQPGDSAVALVIFKKNATIISISLVKFSGNNPTVWSRRAFKLSPIPVTPDTVIIGAASSDAFNTANVKNGSYVIFDALSFNTTQIIPNGGFENWNLYSYENPANWNSFNAELASFGLKYVEKTTGAYKGSYACKIKTIYEPQSQNFVFELTNAKWGSTGWMGGFNYSKTADTLVGWYKYFPKITGNAMLSISFKKAGVEIHWSGNQLSASSVWKKFEIPFFLPVSPDTAMIIIGSSEWPASFSDTGSVLIIDEVQFKSAPLNTGLKAISDAELIEIFPNPTKDGFYIFYNPLANSKMEYLLLDQVGRIVVRNNLEPQKTYVTTSGLSPGIYFLKINDDNRIITKKIIVQ